MKSPFLTRSIAGLLSVVLIGAATTASAATLTWNPAESVPYSPPPFNTPGVWGTSTATWWNGASNEVWNNAGNNVASFPETLTGYPVTLGSDVTLASFSTSVSAFISLGNTNPNNYAVTIEGTIGSGVVATGAASAYIYFDAPVNFSTAIRNDFTVSDSTRLRFNQGITSSGDITLRVGDVTRIGGNSTYTGTTLLSGSGLTLEVASDTALGTSTLRSFSTATTNTIQAIGAPVTLANAIELATFASSSKSLTIGGSQNMTFNGNVAFYSPEGDLGTHLNVEGVTATFNGDFVPPTAQAWAVTKAGTGTLIMNGDNSYLGDTTINAGTFGGNATLAGALVVNANGTLAPGNSPGLLSVGSLDLNGTTILEINGLNRGTQYDAINIASSGAVDFGGALTFSFGNLDPFAGSPIFDLFNFNTSSSGNFSSVSSTGFAAYSGTWSLSGDVWTLDSNPNLTFNEVTGDLAVIPEPGYSLLIAFGIIAILSVRRRRMQ